MARLRTNKRRPKVPADLPVIRALDDVVAERAGVSKQRAASNSAREATGTWSRTKTPTFGPFGPGTVSSDASRVEREDYAQPRPPSEEDIEPPEREPQTPSVESEVVYVELDELESDDDQPAAIADDRDDFLHRELRVATGAIRKIRRELLPDAVDVDAADLVEDLREQLDEVEAESSETIATLRHDLDLVNEALERAKGKQNALEQMLREKQEEVDDLTRALEQNETPHEEVIAADLDEVEAAQEEELQEELELADDDEEEEEELPLAGSARRLTRKSKNSKERAKGSVRHAANAAPKQPRAKRALKKSKTR